MRLSQAAKYAANRVTMDEIAGLEAKQRALEAKLEAIYTMAYLQLDIDIDMSAGVEYTLSRILDAASTHALPHHLNTRAWEAFKQENGTSDTP